MAIDVDIRGVLRTSMLDFPGKLACVVFTNKCNFRCPFCYNTELALGKPSEPRIPVEEFISFLESRRKWLQGVAITGGEPTLHKGLPEFCAKIKEFGFDVKVDSNGYNPEMLEALFSQNLVDYVAMDIKAPKGNYSKAAGVKVDIGKIEQSIAMIKEQAPEYEFRTTIIPELIGEKEILSISKWLSKGSKPKRFFLQQFKNDSRMIDRKLEGKAPLSPDKLKAMAESVKPFFEEVGVRGI